MACCGRYGRHVPVKVNFIGYAALFQNKQAFLNLTYDTPAIHGIFVFSAIQNFLQTIIFLPTFFLESNPRVDFS